jgi:L-amino acid N-acyltransferase YncA
MSRLIRMARAEDAAAISAIYAPHCERTAVSFETEAPSVAEMTRRIAAVQVSFPWLVLEAAGAVLAYSYASLHHPRAAYGWSVDAAIYVREGCEGRGIGRALYGTLFTLLRQQGLHVVCAQIAVPNEGSVALHLACGFTHVGTYLGVGYKFGAWRDVAHYQLALRQQTGAPQAVTPIAQLIDMETWRFAP